MVHDWLYAYIYKDMVKVWIVKQPYADCRGYYTLLKNCCMLFGLRRNCCHKNETLAAQKLVRGPSNL